MQTIFLIDRVDQFTIQSQCMYNVYSAVFTPRGVGCSRSGLSVCAHYTVMLVCANFYLWFGKQVHIRKRVAPAYTIPLSWSRCDRTTSRMHISMFTMNTLTMPSYDWRVCRHIDFQKKIAGQLLSLIFYSCQSKHANFWVHFLSWYSHNTCGVGS